MARARKLTTDVVASGGVIVPAGTAEDELPDGVEIDNPTVWDDYVDETADDTSAANTDVVPPRSGKGSGRDAWAAYAAEHSVDVASDATRDDIIEALEAADVATE